MADDLDSKLEGILADLSGIKTGEKAYDPESVALVVQIINELNRVLDGVARDDFGTIIHPQELEVMRLLEEKSQGGSTGIPPYNRGSQDRWCNPEEYLKEFFGKFLKRYNLELEADCISVGQLEELAPNFRNTLSAYAKSRSETLNDYVSLEKKRLAYLVETKIASGIDLRKLRNASSSLYKAYQKLLQEK